MTLTEHNFAVASGSLPSWLISSCSSWIETRSSWKRFPLTFLKPDGLKQGNVRRIQVLGEATSNHDHQPRQERGFCLSALKKVEVGNDDCDWDLSFSPVLHQNPSSFPPEPCSGVHQKGCDLEGVEGATPPHQLSLPKTMDRIQNLAALETIVKAMHKQSPDSMGMEQLRRAAYLHTIIEAMLSDQVACLPDTGRVCS